MSLVEFGQGGDYLRAQDIKEDQKGSILRAPTVEKTMIRNETKVVARFPMQVEGYEEEVTWSPGKNAVRFLLSQLGTDESKWTYPVAGRFEERKVDTQAGKKLAWFFVPSGKSLISNIPGTKTKTKTASFKCGMCSKAFPIIAELQAHLADGHNP